MATELSTVRLHSDKFTRTPVRPQFETSLKSSTMTSVGMPTESAVLPDTEYSIQVEGIADKAKKSNTLVSFKSKFIDSPVVVDLNFDDLKAVNSTNIKLLEGINGNAGYFNGETSYIDMGNSPDLNCSGNMSVSVWFKLENPEKDSYYRILSKRETWNAPNG